MKPKTLLIGIDGVQIEHFQPLSTALKRLNYNRAYTGGIVGEVSEQPTYSGPGWMTVLTGTWANKHRVTGNDERLRLNPAFPTVLRHLKDNDSTLQVSSVVTWQPIHTFQQHALNGIDAKWHDNDEAALAQVEKLIETASADMTFLHLDGPDHVAHNSGFGPQYDEALRKADIMLNRLLDRVETRARERTDEDWLVIVTTDHGRTPSGKDHGGQTPSEKTIFIACNKAANDELMTIRPAEGQGPGLLYGYAAHTAIAPTIMRHMGCTPTPDAWRMDSIPLIGPLGVRKLRMDKLTSTLRWFSDDPVDPMLIQDNAPIGSIPAIRQSWLVPHGITSGHAYSVKLNDTYACVRCDAIQTVLDWSGSALMFFFTNGTYSRFNLDRNQTEPGYPSETLEANWRGLAAYKHRIIASFSDTDTYAYFMLNDGTYIKYDKKQDKALAGYPLPITNQTWPGMGPYATQIKTIVRWNNNKMFVFLKNNTYLRYDLGGSGVDSGYPKPVNEQNWPELARYSERMRCAVRNGKGNHAYFFLDDMTYIKYDMNKERFVDEPPAMVATPHWPGLKW